MKLRNRLMAKSWAKVAQLTMDNQSILLQSPQPKPTSPQPNRR